MGEISSPNCFLPPQTQLPLFQSVKEMGIPLYFVILVMNECQEQVSHGLQGGGRGNDSEWSSDSRERHEGLGQNLEVGWSAHL